MSITKQEFANYIRRFQFRELFNELGWDNDRTVQPIIVDDSIFQLQAVASKSGFIILLCPAPGTDPIPLYPQRKQIETKVTKLFQEHLIIYTDCKKQEQVWQFVLRQRGQPTKVTETRYHISQQPELLYQRASGLFFDFDDEGKITIVDVTQKVTENFYSNTEKVTKQFYDKFKKHHTSFLSFIHGIKEKVDQDWYASLMLNRLMFCYFIQRKGFLDNNKNYLRDKLKESQARKGKDKFYSFYRSFLMVLFHQGLGNPEHSDELKKDIGRIPYLNGGLFDEHELEKKYSRIDISDKAFEAIFDFFDEYEWHLDTRNTATGRDINPDVIGYIFEKYINDRSQMGAYYTKEDITEYISKNCIIPYLFDETQRQYSKSFTEFGEIWSTVKQSGDRYIYEAVKKGAQETLPPEITAGIEDIGKREDWNKPASFESALPTEIWREVVDRLNRYHTVKEKIEKGEILSINDFITYNLDIRQFAQDLIENTEDPDLLRHFYKSLNHITILDPTCGSGAFLFAAMNILEPLYEACLMRMENYISDTPKGKYKFFEEVLQTVKSPEHPNLQYFIFKSIILRNLYGVDLMKEAVEIAKLRLFLKLVGAVEVDYRKPNLGLEPLPDIDFNIRSGNTLVGFATEGELKRGLDYTFDGVAAKPIIEEKCEVVAMAFNRYKEIQLTHGDDYIQFRNAKDELCTRLKELNIELNNLMYLQANSLAYESWLESHRPFHWFAEFFEIIHERSGFDVIIGNPPYIETKKIHYNISSYKTSNCGNIYAPIIERYFSFLNNYGRSGMIIPHSSICTDRMENLIKFLTKYGLWLSSYDIRPSKLFDGADQRLLIYLTVFNPKNILTSRYHRWFSDFRPYLFQRIEYLFGVKSFVPNSIIKANKQIESKIIKKLSTNTVLAKQVSGSLFIYFHNTPRYFIRVMDRVPYFWNEKDGEKISTQVKGISFGKKESTYVIGSLLNSSLFYWWFILFSDSRHLNNREIDYFPFSVNDLSVALKNDLVNVFIRLNEDYHKNKSRKSAFYKATGNVEYDEYYPKKSKAIIDEIDTLLAKHYGFTDDEMDFIINYDIKYRMGKELENEEDDEYEK